MAAVNASPVEPVGGEEPEAYGDDEHEGSTVHSHASTVLRSATASMPAVVVQPPSQSSGVQHLPQDHDHADSNGQGHGCKLHKASKEGRRHDDERGHHDEQFRAVRLNGTFSYASHCYILRMFCADAPRTVSRRRQPSLPSNSRRQVGVRSSAWVSPSMRS